MGWSAIVIAALTAGLVTLALALVRQRLLLRALAEGLTALRQDRFSVRAPSGAGVAWLGNVLREPADLGAGEAFDRLAERLEQRRFEANLAPRGGADEVGPALVALLEATLPPLRQLALRLAADAIRPDARLEVADRLRDAGDHRVHEGSWPDPTGTLRALAGLLDRLDRRLRFARDPAVVRRGLSALVRLADEGPDLRPRLRPLGAVDAVRLELPLALAGIHLAAAEPDDEERTAVPSGLPPVVDVSPDRSDAWETLARRHPAFGYPPAGVLLVARSADGWGWLRLRDALPLDPELLDAELIAAWRANEPGNEVSIRLPAAHAHRAGDFAERLAGLGCRVVPSDDSAAPVTSSGVLVIRPARLTPARPRPSEPGSASAGSEGSPASPSATSLRHAEGLVVLVAEDAVGSDQCRLFAELATLLGAEDLSQLAERLAPS